MLVSKLPHGQAVAARRYFKCCNTLIIAGRTVNAQTNFGVRHGFVRGLIADSNTDAVVRKWNSNEVEVRGGIAMRTRNPPRMSAGVRRRQEVRLGPIQTSC